MQVRSRIAILLLMSLIIIAVWTFPTWYPVLRTESIREVFPGLALELQDDFLRLPPEEREAFFALLEEETLRDAALPMVQARLMEDTLAPEEEILLDLPDAVVRLTGEFGEIDVIRQAEGEVMIYEQPDFTRLLRIEEFRSTRAPDLKVILTRNPQPLEQADVGVDYIVLGDLKANVGNQTYAIPEGVDFNRYPAVALYSEQYGVVISSATLR